MGYTNKDKQFALEMMEQQGFQRLQREHDDAFGLMFDEHGTKRRVLLAEGRWLTPTYHSMKMHGPNMMKCFIKSKGISVSGLVYFTGKELLFEPKEGTPDWLCESWAMWDTTDHKLEQLNDLSWFRTDRKPTDEELDRYFKQMAERDAYEAELKSTLKENEAPTNTLEDIELESTLEDSSAVSTLNENQDIEVP